MVTATVTGRQVIRADIAGFRVGGENPEITILLKVPLSEEAGAFLAFLVGARRAGPVTVTIESAQRELF